MSERKYTDEEIVKALECFSVGVGCKGCPFIDQGCFDCGNIPTEFSESVLALIKRQKAEIERLKAEQMMAEGYADALEERARAEAIKEFVERLKETPIKLGLPLLGLLTKSEIEDYFNHTLLQVRDAIDNIVAEMTEGK